jgi:hypothetical protein
MGGGKSSGSSAPVVTQEQKDQIAAQTGLLTKTLIPNYEKTISGANRTYGNLTPYVEGAAKEEAAKAGALSNLATNGGIDLVQQGATNLKTLFDPNYEKNQINAALQSGNEAARESYGQSNASMGAAGQLGSARNALAGQNLQSLNAQRQATAAAGAQAQVQANRAAASQAIMGQGQELLGTGATAAANRLNFAQAPMDLENKYASIVFGTPGASGGNFQGTQGTNTKSSGFGFKFS